MEPLAEELQAAFLKSPYTKGYKLSIVELPNAVVIRGRVRSFFHKQMVQEEVGKFLKSKGQQGLRLTLQNEITVD